MADCYDNETRKNIDNIKKELIRVSNDSESKFDYLDDIAYKIFIDRQHQDWLRNK